MAFWHKLRRIASSAKAKTRSALSKTLFIQESYPIVGPSFYAQSLPKTAQPLLLRSYIAEYIPIDTGKTKTGDLQANLDDCIDATSQNVQKACILSLREVLQSESERNRTPSHRIPNFLFIFHEKNHPSLA